MNFFKAIILFSFVFISQILIIQPSKADKIPIAIIAEFTVKPEKEKELLKILIKHAQLTRQEEPGCLRFELLGPVNENGSPILGKLFLSELYVNQAAVDAHEGSSRVIKTIASMEPLLISLKVNRAVGLTPLGH